MTVIKLTDPNGQAIYFSVDIAFREFGNETQIKWDGSLFVVKESHEEVSQKLLEFREKKRCRATK